MRQVAYALVASCALMLGAQTSASAGCYGECNGYQDRSGPPPYERYERPAYRSYREPCCAERSSYYDDGPRYHTTYYERGPEYRTSYYDDGYDGGYRSYRGYGYGYAPTVRYGGAWSQTGPAYASYRGYGGYGYGRGYGYGYGGGYGGCRTAYIPYGWTWYRAHSC